MDTKIKFLETQCFDLLLVSLKKCKDRLTSELRHELAIG